MVSEVQSVIFAQRYWSTARAQKWLCEHGFVWDSKVDIKPNQFDPLRYKKYGIKKIKPRVELVIGFKK